VDEKNKVSKGSPKHAGAPNPDGSHVRTANQKEALDAWIVTSQMLPVELYHPGMPQAD
jgi:hypothetical protein